MLLGRIMVMPLHRLFILGQNRNKMKSKAIYKERLT